MIHLDLLDITVIGLIVLFCAAVMPRLATWLHRRHVEFKKACDEFENNMRGW